jgi:hypothetical protein
MKNVCLWYVAVEGAKMAMVLGWRGSESCAGPGNTDNLTKSVGPNHWRPLENNTHVLAPCLMTNLYINKPFMERWSYVCYEALFSFNVEH